MRLLRRYITLSSCQPRSHLTRRFDQSATTSTGEQTETNLSASLSNSVTNSNNDETKKPNSELNQTTDDTSDLVRIFFLYHFTALTLETSRRYESKSGIRQLTRVPPRRKKGRIAVWMTTTTMTNQRKTKMVTQTRKR